MTDKPDRLLRAVRQKRERHRFWQQSGEPSLAGRLAQIGVLGWTIVLPTLGGTLIGRWIDRRFGTGIFWTGPLLLAGLGLGSWAAWRWMHRQ
ncbi:AtpZ/AtpI family protein [Acidiphilium sp. JA12-A1]|jgi:ATP synthase protein I|uniref:AtpZ/AtpI family protein n=1 Tax=Acidiphilium sp. JA12-A1 TaxID=1464546 RepID=UPI0004619E52|nr:AtpZ/AtpI family protein [Acidiphilium sp. JA12-A1]KDM65380.1 putative F0F1-ATPase subunit [Acidiphilium sp. JA12-A1]